MRLEINGCSRHFFIILFAWFYSELWDDALQPNKY